MVLQSCCQHRLWCHFYNVFRSSKPNVVYYVFSSVTDSCEIIQYSTKIIHMCTRAIRCLRLRSCCQWHLIPGVLLNGIELDKTTCLVSSTNIKKNAIDIWTVQIISPTKLRTVWKNTLCFDWQLLIMSSSCGSIHSLEVDMSSFTPIEVLL